MRRMDPAVLAMGGIVLLILLVGIVSVLPRDGEPVEGLEGDGLTGNVVVDGSVPAVDASPTRDECTRCEGAIVCAVKDGRAANYESACAAVCSGARVLKEGLCESS